MKKYLALACGLVLTTVPFSMVKAQLIVNGGTITIGDNASIIVQGDFTTNTDILGTGKIVLNGTSAQQLNLNGSTVPNLEVNSTGGVILAGNGRIGNTLNFVTGKIQAGGYNLTLASNVAVTGAGPGNFVETNGIGQLRKEVAGVGTYDLPVGLGANYMPLQYQVTAGTVAAGAYVATNLIASAHPKKPIRASDNLTSYWKASYNGITGATVNAVGTYADAGGINGDESLLNAIRYDGTDWSLANSSINTSTNSITFNNVAATGTDLYAMNKFLLTNAKAYLQGAYNAATGKMTDRLRTPTNLIPLSDPYRSAPYSNSFTHVANSTPEVASATVFQNQTNDDDNIVDWVFLQLRNSSNAVVQTRSALLQKDGDIVDVDGVSPVAFLNLDAANYVLSVRHRNHLAVSAEPSTYAKTLSVANPTNANRFDFTTATDDQIYGTSAAYNVTASINMLWAGNAANASVNNRVSYNGPANDRDYILSTILGGNQGAQLSGVYSEGDLNLDRLVRYNGPGNDRDFMLATALAGAQGTIRTQALPN